MAIISPAGCVEYPSRAFAELSLASGVGRAELLEIEAREPGPQAAVAFDVGETGVFENVVAVFGGGVAAAEGALLDLDSGADFLGGVGIRQEAEGKDMGASPVSESRKPVRQAMPFSLRRRSLAVGGRGGSIGIGIRGT